MRVAEFPTRVNQGCYSRWGGMRVAEFPTRVNQGCYSRCSEYTHVNSTDVKHLLSKGTYLLAHWSEKARECDK